MTDQEILDALSRILRDLLSNESIVLTMATRRPDVPDWDSFNYVTFIVAVEVELGIRSQLSDVEAFGSVGDIVSKIHELKH